MMCIFLIITAGVSFEIRVLSIGLLLTHLGTTECKVDRLHKYNKIQLDAAKEVFLIIYYFVL